MQVSPTFNAIVAPRLYHTITLTDSSGLSDPFGGAKRGVLDIPVKKAWMKKTKAKQKTQGKEKDLGHIRHLFFEGRIPPDFRESNRKLLESVRTIRFRLFTNYEELDNRYIRKTVSRPSEDGKLVFTGLDSRCLSELSWSAIKYSTVVIHLHRLQVSPIEWAYDPAQFRGNVKYVFLDQIKVNRPVHMNAHLGIAIRGIAHAGSRTRGPRTILVVNAPDNVIYPGAAEQSMEECVTEFVELEKKKDNSLTSSTDVVPPQYPTIKFLSMREYLRDYDWAGEFTDEEVKPWLEDEGFEML